MTNDQDGGQSPQYDQGRLLLWQKFYEAIQHSDRAAVDIGVFVLKVMMIINAGALLALLAALGQFKDNRGMSNAIADPAPLFL